ncbi:cytochrome C assembly family protein [Kushneria phosphatilytica]|uniref:Cytochrome C biogenesis protein n=1 Tax=Kushneria phosphatilytica TaxID=657387 RepID=A0A1S1NVR8_9GAMM|nr:cytochrome c biogenesis protein CcsA [Kushneria phosphatilytica]OHV10872.1 cytochrome C biogenesis protein [Kushneria phosphatilytica]QEL12045.1 cytochrome C biogenesis protein [Kushneria phosphatilytica]
MPTLLIAFLAVMLYASAALHQALALNRLVPMRPRLIQCVGALAVLCHAIIVYNSLAAHGGLHVGLFESASLIAWLIALTLLLVSLFRPVLAAATGLFPLAALSVTGVVGLPSPMVESSFPPGLIIHIVTSTLAYAFLMIAAGQAILIALQTQALKRHRIRGIIQVLPPLTSMERLMFQLIICGMVLLTASLISGAVTLDHLVARHLAHKTGLSVLAWLIFGGLLWGRYQRGWRGPRAIRWTLAGVAVLLLAYFGSKFVLEIMLHRSW